MAFIDNRPITQNVQFDGYGNPVSIVYDGSYHRLQVDAKATDADGNPLGSDGYLNAKVIQYNEDGLPLAVADNDDVSAKQPGIIAYALDGYCAGNTARALKTIQDNCICTGIDRLAVQTTIAPGQSILIGSPIPEALGNYVQERFRLNGTGTDSLIINGSVIPQEFIVYAPDAGDGFDIAIGSIRLVMTAQDITFDGGSFNSRPTLANGLEIELIAANEILVIPIIYTNEDFMFLPSDSGFLLNNTGPKDVLKASINFGNSPILYRGSGDKAIITVNDNLLTGSLNYFKAQLYGEKINI